MATGEHANYESVGELYSTNWYIKCSIGSNYQTNILNQRQANVGDSMHHSGIQRLMTHFNVCHLPLGHIEF